MITEIRITEGTKNLEMLSAREARRVFCAVASRTRSAIWARREAFAGFVTITSASPERTMAPAETACPLVSSTGKDSPVRVELSIDACSELSSPSAGTAWPAATEIRSPAFRSELFTWLLWPAKSRVAWSGRALSSDRTASVALRLVFTSRYRPISTTVGTTAAISK